MPLSASITFRVRYFETDQMQVAHHAHYFVWFEAARSEFCRASGVDYRAMEKDGLFLPIADAQCRYRMPARYDDEVTITIRIAEITRRTLRFAYTVLRGADGADLIAEAETVQVLVDRNGRPRSFPQEIAARLASVHALA